MLDLFPSRNASPFGRRRERGRRPRIPVTVVTGFLGAGKTTLVEHFLETPEGRQAPWCWSTSSAKQGIDDALLRNSDRRRLCCSAMAACAAIPRSDLQNALHRMVVDRERGVIPPFVRVVIETSARRSESDPQTFSTDRALGGEFLSKR